MSIVKVRTSVRIRALAGFRGLVSAFFSIILTNSNIFINNYAISSKNVADLSRPVYLVDVKLKTKLCLSIKF